VTAEEALALGMVERVVPDDGFGDAWRAWADTFAAGPQTAIGFMKQNVQNASAMTLADAIAVESRLQVESSATADHREAVRAWVEKRDPNFGPP
jgi:2-(1,2-epoxy-1,2-dihydrophenyl)acetyl-CoA isomerase